MKFGRFEICLGWEKGGRTKKWWELSIIFCYGTRKFKDWKKRQHELYLHYKKLGRLRKDREKTNIWVEEAAEISKEDFQNVTKRRI